MSPTENTQSRDDQEMWISFGAPLFTTNGISKTNESNCKDFDLKKILNLQIEEVKAESDLLKNKDNLFFKFKQINFSNCGLIQIPNAVFNLKYLTALNLSNNFLESLPKELGYLCNLITLILSGNKLSCLPKSIIHIQQLNYLNLSSNKFLCVPEVLYYGLRFLKILDLSHNEITQLNEPLGCLNKLVMLKLTDNFLEKLPLWVFDSLCQLQFLDISQNKLNLNTELINYHNFGVFNSLQSLNVYNCNLRHEDVHILSSFRNLRVLYLGNGNGAINKLKENNFFGNLKIEMFKNFVEIKELYLPRVQIASLPTEFACLKHIEVLDLSDNFLSWLPESICDLINLKILNLLSNQILFLPINIGNLINLEQIHLGNNKLSDIPESFYNLANLKFVDLYNNKIEKVKSNIITKKNLKGIDLELNCLDFSEFEADANKIKVLYNCLKDSFRNHFFYLKTRHDLQESALDKNLNEMRCNTPLYNIIHSESSYESEIISDSEDLYVSMTQQSYLEDEDWEKRDSNPSEEDEYFDPNKADVDKWISIHSSSLDFQNNYCPANYHVPLVMKSYTRNFKIASKNETVEEGQFDSD